MNGTHPCQPMLHGIAAIPLFLGPRARPQGWSALIAIGIFHTVFAAQMSAARLPGDHARWIGTYQVEAAAGDIYDFRFQADGEVWVEKSVGGQLLAGTFRWSEVDGGIRLAGELTGPLPELSGGVLRRSGPHLFQLALYGKQSIQIRRSFSVLPWIHAIFMFTLVFAGNELCRRFRFASYVAFLLMPAVVLLLSESPFENLHRFGKLVVALSGALLVTLIRFRGLDRFPSAKLVVAAFLAATILQAGTEDMTSGRLPHVLNAGAGVICILTMSRCLGIKRDSSAPHDLLWPGMTRGWILVYDLWNFTFLYLNYPNTALFAFAILLAATVSAFYVQKGTWLQARTYTVSLYMIYAFALDALAVRLDAQLVLPLPRSEEVALGLTLLSLGASLAYGLLHLRWRLTGLAPSNLEIGQSETVIGERPSRTRT